MCVISEINSKQGTQGKIDKCLNTKFYGKTSAHMSKILKHNSSHAIDIIVFYKIRKSIIFKVLDVVVYWFIKKYVCVHYLCLQMEAKLLLLHRGFEDTSFYELSGIGTPEHLLNTVSWYVYIQEKKSTLILTRRSKLILYSI